MSDLKIPGLTQLLDMVASGVGSVAGPMLATWTARRLGEAKRIEAQTDADVLRIQAKAQSEARAQLVPTGSQATTELDLGTAIAQRVRFQEQKRQANITSVVAKAASAVGDRQVDASEPDHDWTARFFNEVQDVSSEQMQGLWARVLAGEVERKGSTSVHTLQVLKNLNVATARLFRTLCSCSVFMPARRPRAVDARLPSLGGNIGDNALRDYGLSYDNVTSLREHGLISTDLASWYPYAANFPGERIVVPFEFQNSVWILTLPNAEVRSPKRWDGKIHGVALSSFGAELAAVIDLEPAESFERALLQHLESYGISVVKDASR